MKRCPFCAEEIQDDATKCRFCGEFLKKKKGWLGCLFGCLITAVAIILLLLLFAYLSFLAFKFIMYNMFYRVPRMPYPYYFPFREHGLEYLFRDFNELLRNFLDRLMELFGSSRVTL